MSRRYSNEYIESVKDANDIVEVVGSYIQLKKKGRSYFGLCPFHGEKTPSFSVSPDKQIYHCFGCDKGGTVIQFIQEMEGLNFPEAIEFLAKRVNMPLPKAPNAYDNKKEELKSRLYNINYDAVKYFQKCLFLKSSKIVQDYVNKRKMNRQTLIDFKIGYSKVGLNSYLRKKGYSQSDILKTGLVYKTDDGKYIDRYRDRLMFPILDEYNNVIGFGGRRLSNNEKQAKYINSNDNILYNKSRSLYNINNAKKYSRDYMIVVEGYMDCITLYQNGIKNVVASLGTALTEGQARLMNRYTKKIIISYDSDGAGQSATLRGLDILKKTGVDLRVLKLEGAKDPDEYILKYGVDSLKKRIDEAISYIDFKTEVYSKQYDLTRPDEKAQFITKLVSEVAKLDNAIEQEVYISKFSKQYNINEEALKVELEKEKGKLQNNEINESDFVKNVEQKKRKDTNISKKDRNREDTIISAYLNNKEYRNIILENITEYMFKDERNKEVFKYIITFNDEGVSQIVSELENICENSEKEEEIYYNNILGRITEILSDDILITDNLMIRLLKEFKKEELEKEKNVILDALKISNLDDENRKMLEKRLNELIIEISKN